MHGGGCGFRGLGKRLFAVLADRQSRVCISWAFLFSARTVLPPCPGSDCWDGHVFAYISPVPDWRAPFSLSFLRLISRGEHRTFSEGRALHRGLCFFFLVRLVHLQYDTSFLQTLSPSGAE